MKISDAFPSNYLKAADLNGRTVQVIIDHIDMETLGDDRRPVVYFQNKEKGLVLNKTNANNIAAVHGDDTDEWVGRPIILYPAMVDFQGRSVEAIRVNAKPQPARTSKAPPPPPEPTYADLDDEIPF